MTASTWSELKCAFISDVHLCSARTPTDHILTNLRQAFPNTAETKELDIIFIAGDLYDDIEYLASVEAVLVDHWLAEFLRTCEANDVLVCILEGTPSHDWRQARRMVDINTYARIGAQVMYVDTLSIHYLERFGLHVLFVPDEWETSTDETLRQVRALMEAKGLTQVDFSIMHGLFGFQLPAHVKNIPRHDEHVYSQLTKFIVSIGHDHGYAQWENIVAQGSFDRLSHGEEAPKGHVRGTFYPDGRRRLQFVENTGAMTYLTQDCRGDDLQAVFTRLDALAQKHPPGSRMRLWVKADHPILAQWNTLTQRYPQYVWSKKIEEDKVEKEEEIVTPVSFTPITFTANNLPEKIRFRLLHSDASDALINRALLELEGLLK